MSATLDADMHARMHAVLSNLPGLPRCPLLSEQHYADHKECPKHILSTCTDSWLVDLMLPALCDRGGSDEVQSKAALKADARRSRCALRYVKLAIVAHVDHLHKQTQVEQQTDSAVANNVTPRKASTPSTTESQRLLCDGLDRGRLFD